MEESGPRKREHEYRANWKFKRYNKEFKFFRTKILISFS
jgi:hypothetical protein